MIERKSLQKKDFKNAQKVKKMKKIPRNKVARAGMERSVQYFQIS